MQHGTLALMECKEMKKYLLFILLLLLIAACTPKPIAEQIKQEPKAGAEETAQKLTIALNDKDYTTVYSMMVPEYTSQISQDNFIMAMEDVTSGWSYIYSNIIIVGDKANAVIKVKSNVLVDSELPIKLAKVGEEWKVDAFGGVILQSCRAQGGLCMSACDTPQSQAADLKCATGWVCCRKCQQDTDCPQYQECNHQTYTCDPHYTIVEITPYDIFAQYCTKRFNDEGCKTAYNFLFNGGKPSTTKPVTVSSNCNYDYSRHDLIYRGYLYFEDWHICARGYLYYVEPKSGQAADIKAMDVKDISKLYAEH